MDAYPAELEKKMKLLSYFRRYMNEHLMTAGSNVPRVLDSVSRTPYLYQWFRTSQGVFMCLTNGTVQVISETSVSGSSGSQKFRSFRSFLNLRESS